MKKSLKMIAISILSMATINAYAAVAITEVAPWGSSATTTPYATDWFELTNFGTSAINITGWKMDDNSNSFASSIALTGITSIAAGESVIFTENPATISFLNTWFGSNVPTGLQIGNYTGAGVGLSATADAVNIYNNLGALQANVTFGAADAVAPFQTFDNAAGLNNVAIATLSTVGTNSAFAAVNPLNISTVQIGSPGLVAAPVPEPENYALMMAGLGLINLVARKRQA